MKHSNLSHETLLKILFEVWSEKSSTKYSPDNPARGQCGVTALVVNDLLGGEILKTPLSEGWHFYKRINGQVYDFTSSQFSGEIEYQDIPSTRDEAFADTNEQQYTYLSQAVWNRIDKP
ncbi:YunG family protein [Lihuaxuella thermophila]|uniref:YunG n=1 Tax=Lihuaxuella thermophila TaxID=1173111 RepID=A0A1H8BC80_9BACL|nr:hypothetical protein [Lihuaxuella thermophila]SEM80443.1 hypothetical protein SAMN05444955_102108 [Lihuaxuella thermophila]